MNGSFSNVLFHLGLTYTYKKRISWSDICKACIGLNSYQFLICRRELTCTGHLIIHLLLDAFLGSRGVKVVLSQYLDAL